MKYRLLLGLYILLGTFALGSAGGFVVHAQSQFGNVDPLTLTIDPNYPKPYQIVTVTPGSDLIDLSASTVTFSVNGTVVQRGSGTESASIAVGGPGTVTNITLTVVNNGQTYTEKTSVRPADVALVLEPISSTHPFYEGAPLIGSEGRLRLIAVPDLRTSVGKPIPASSLVYTWKNDDQILQSSSGIGKSVLSATASVRYRDSTITVIVSSQDSSITGSASVRISPTDPVVRIYENDPLLGPRYENALPNSITMTGSEETYRVVPYFFSSLPSLAWSVNGTPSQTGQDITVRPTGNGKGTALLGVDAESDSPVQSGASSLSVTFGASAKNIFGF
ncbi:MAG: hypothetical protein JWN90_101 [Parcubacteria group bacterium]|nr:hypothetical protein [Parcubacteria group bacterium]